MFYFFGGEASNIILISGCIRVFCRVTDEFDAYIVVSFLNATLVLSIGETVEEVSDSGFIGFTSTLACSTLGDNAAVQVRIF